MFPIQFICRENMICGVVYDDVNKRRKCNLKAHYLSFYIRGKLRCFEMKMEKTTVIMTFSLNMFLHHNMFPCTSLT